MPVTIADDAQGEEVRHIQVLVVVKYDILRSIEKSLTTSLSLLVCQ